MDTALQLFGVGLLAFTRVVLVFVQAPIFGSHHIPKPILAGLAGAVTIAMFPHIPVPADMPDDLLPFMGALLSQACVGLVIGFVSFLVMAAAQFGGEMLDIQMGLSVAASFDPASHGAVNLLRKVHFYLAMNLYLVLDGHHALIQAINASFRVVPVTYFQINGDIAMEMIRLSANLLVIGTQVAAPALSALFITQCALGLLARVAPQMNVFMLSFPLNIAIGLALLTFSLPLIVRLIGVQFDINLDHVVHSIQMMVPPGR